jgi:hypothetical protein
MELTKETALRGSLELWTWLMNNPSLEKKDWPGWDKYGGIEKHALYCLICTLAGNTVCVGSEECDRCILRGKFPLEYSNASDAPQKYCCGEYGNDETKTAFDAWDCACIGEEVAKRVLNANLLVKMLEKEIKDFECNEKLKKAEELAKQHVVDPLLIQEDLKRGFRVWVKMNDAPCHVVGKYMPKATYYRLTQDFLFFYKTNRFEKLQSGNWSLCVFGRVNLTFSTEALEELCDRPNPIVERIFE